MSERPGNALMPNLLTPMDLEPNWEWRDKLPAHGHMSVDFENRVNHDRLRRYRLARTRQSLQNSNAGTLLLFDVNNIRYVSATKIGEWERDKMCRFCLLTGDDSPYVWDFGSAAEHHKRHSDWLEPSHCLAGVVGMRGTIPPEFGLMQKYAKQIAGLIRDAGMADMPVGVDYAETAMFHALQQEGLNVVDGQQIMLAAREIKNTDEIQLLTQAAAMVDGVYHMIYEVGSDDVEAINAISGERCNPHPHNFTDRLIRPGDQAFFDILQSYQGYRTCYYRTFNVGRATPSQTDAYTKAREWIDASIAMIKPGVSTDKVAAVWPTAQELGFANEDQAFGLQFGHGLGLALHERPIISRAVSMDHPMEIKTGMVFALETYCPATDGYSAARIEEEVVVTETGCEVISLFPAETLPIANRY
jgi:Xaa-Pro aminopeptidase